MRGARTTRITRPLATPLRARMVLVFLAALLALMAGRAIYLQAWNADYLKAQGNARYLRMASDSSHRGMILDRNGEPLAISTPVDSVWAQPAEFAGAREQWPALARVLGVPLRELATLVTRHAGREFMYIKRQVTPDEAERVTALNLPGVGLLREYRRYYPAGAVAGHVVGFTNIDDRGQEGVELAYDKWLRGEPGRVRVLKDRFGHVVETVENVSLPEPGRDLVLSLDRRIQYLAYRELKAALESHHAQAASAIVLDTRSGEVLAMVNVPGFNPNSRNGLSGELFRNRTVTDVFEPGSTIKPFTVAMALESGRFKPDTPIDTGPGFLQVGSNTVRDVHNYGRLTVSQVLEKSSNVGASKIALATSKQELWSMFQRVGFGSTTGSGLPGEVSGRLNPPQRWVPIDHASAAYGYGVSMTLMQLARAYSAIANDGVLMPVTLVKSDQPAAGQRVMSATVAHQVRAMLELAVSRDGTGAAAQVASYRVAGKTGTARKLGSNGYTDNSYIASFAGFAPATDPRLLMVVMVDDPTSGGYYGGQIAAPVFGKVMAGAMRLLDIPPDNLPPQPSQHMAHNAHAGGQG